MWKSSNDMFAFARPRANPRQHSGCSRALPSRLDTEVTLTGNARSAILAGASRGARHKAPSATNRQVGFVNATPLTRAIIRGLLFRLNLVWNGQFFPQRTTELARQWRPAMPDASRCRRLRRTIPAACICSAGASPVIAHAVAVFGDEQKATHWLSTPLALFNNRPPTDLLA